MGKRLLFVVNVDWFFLSHRLPIAIEAKKAGYEVHVAVAVTDRMAELQAHGFVVHPLAMQRERAGFMAELAMLAELLRLFRRVRPYLVHLVTIRPVIYGGIAARLARVPRVVAAISGLGSVFVAVGGAAKLRRFVVAMLYRLALRQRSLKVIFQNENDGACLRRLVHLEDSQCELIRGSGVDLSHYLPVELPAGPPVVLMACRLIAEKGVWEFIASARLLKERGIACRFWLAGDIDPGNPLSLTEADLDRIRSEGVVEILGKCDDMPELMSLAWVVALPSYYGEGVPKVLIEAASCGRSIVTTDLPGCRDVVVPGKSGLLVRPRDVESLAGAIGDLFADRAMCERMGREGRQFAESMFDIRDVVARHMKIYAALGSELH